MPRLSGATEDTSNHNSGTNGGNGQNWHESSTVILENIVYDSPIPPHPLGVKPLGNQYLSAEGNARVSLGTFQALPDEVLMQFLEYLDKDALQLLGYTCKFLFAFCWSEDLWKALLIE